MGNRAHLAQHGQRHLLQALRLAVGSATGRGDRLAFAALAVIAAGLMLHGLGDAGILDGNESLYVEAAREMVMSRDWAVPTLNGLPYLEKPPLFVWLLAAASHLGFSTEFAARIVGAAAAFLLAFAVARCSVRLGIERQGVTAAFVLVTSLGIVLMARVAMPDMLLTMLFAHAGMGFLVFLREGQMRHARFAAAMLGAAALVKGALPIALFAMVVALCYATEKAWRPAIRNAIGDPAAVLLLCVPIIAWLVAIDAALPGAASYFVIEEHVLRFLGMREPHDYYSGSLFYYVPRLFLFFFPWPAVLWFGWLSRARDAASERLPARRFLWLCVWVPLAFLSVSSAKANYYIVLCLPPMALLAAEYLPHLLRERRLLALAVLLPGALLIGAIGAGLAGAARGSPIEPLLRAGGMEAIVLVAALTLCALLLVLLQRGRLALACLGISVLPVVFGVNQFAVVADQQISTRGLAAEVRKRFGDDIPVFLFEDFEAAGSLPVYLGRTVPVVDSKSNDLHFGRRVLRHHPNLVAEEAVPADSLLVVLKSRERDFAKTQLSKRAVEVAVLGRATLYRVTTG